MKPQREAVDAAKLVKDWLKTELPQHFPTVQVGLELPADWAPGSAPHLVVFDDSGPTDMWPVANMPTIRLTSWTTGRDLTIVNRAIGLLLSSRIPGVAGILPGTAVIASRDSRNRGDVTSATVRTRIRTTGF